MSKLSNAISCLMLIAVENHFPVISLQGADPEFMWAISHPLLIWKGSKELVYSPVPWSLMW